MPLGLQLIIALVGGAIGLVGRHFYSGTLIFEGLIVGGAFILGLALIRLVNGAGSSR
jgi:hypothetical protein